MSSTSFWTSTPAGAPSATAGSSTLAGSYTGTAPPGDLRTVTSRLGVATKSISWYAIRFSSGSGRGAMSTPKTYAP